MPSPSFGTRKGATDPSSTPEHRVRVPDGQAAWPLTEDRVNRSNPTSDTPSAMNLRKQAMSQLHAGKAAAVTPKKGRTPEAGAPRLGGTPHSAGRHAKPQAQELPRCSTRRPGAHQASRRQRRRATGWSCKEEGLVAGSVKGGVSVPPSQDGTVYEAAGALR